MFAKAPSLLWPVPLHEQLVRKTQKQIILTENLAPATLNCDPPVPSVIWRGHLSCGDIDARPC